MPPQPQPPSKNRKWPWVVGIIAALVVIGNLSDGGDQTQSADVAGDRPAAAAPAPADDSQGPIELGFGESHTWSGGETIAVASPQPFDDPLAFGDTDTRPMAVDVTITNGGDDEYNVMEASFSAQHDGRVAQQNLSSDFLPNTVLPPGGDVTFTLVYDVEPDPGEVRMSVQPNMFAADTAYFIGEF